MESFKKFFLAHGEKAILAIVVLIFGYSTLSLLTKDSNILELPSGRTAKVNPQKTQDNIKRAQDHLQSNVKVMPAPQAEKISHELARKIISGVINDPKVDLEWFEYVQPSPVGAPPLFAKPEAKTAQNIPAEYRTRLGNPQNLQVWSSVNKTLIICKESDYLNYPKPGSRRMMLWRKAIGSGKSKINPEARKQLLRSPRTEVVTISNIPNTKAAETKDAVEGAATPGEKTNNAPVNISGFGIQMPVPDKVVETKEEKFSYEDYKRAYEEQDLRAFNDMKNICTPESVLNSSWTLITPTMYALKVEPTEEVLKEILTNGVNPEIAFMSEEEATAYAKKKASKEKPIKKKVEPKAKPDWEGIMAPKVTKKAEEENEEASDNSEAERTAPRYYVFIDNSVQQNMVYRYGAISSLQPQMPPEDILEKEEHLSWDIYCEVDGIFGSFPDGGAFAPVARFVKKVFADDMSKKSKGVIGSRLKFMPCYVTGTSGSTKTSKTQDKPTQENPAQGDQGTIDTGPKVRVDELRDNKGRLTKLGWAYKNKEFCYSDFVYSDLVLTPKEFEIQLLGAFGGEEPVATVKVHKVKENGETISSTFRLTAENLANSPKWIDFLAKDENGKPAWPPKVLSLTEVYAKKGKFDPKPIGKIIGRKGDFTTGWGLVEVRPFIIRGSVLRLKDGEWKKVSNLPERKDYAAIIAEINPPKGQPRRFARIFRPGSPSKRPESKRFEYEYIWEPELEEKIEAKRKRTGTTK